MNEAELKEMKEDRLANFASSRLPWFASHGPGVGHVGRLARHHKAAHVHGTRLLGVGDLNLHGRLFRLVAVSSYGVDGNATPALGTCCNPFGLHLSCSPSCRFPSSSVGYLQPWNSPMTNGGTSSIHWRIRNVPVHRVQTYTDLLVQVSTSESPTNYRI